MKKKWSGIAFICILSLSYIVVPSPSLLSIQIQAIPLTVSGVYYHFFRKYLKSVPAGSATINHYIYISFTWVVQVFLAFIHLLLLSSFLFQSSFQSKIEEYPLLFCPLLSPMYLTLPLCMHFLYMAGIKLLILIYPKGLLGWNHEKIWRFLQAAVVLAVVVDVLNRLYLTNGIICNPKVAIYFTIFLGLDVTMETFPPGIKSLFIPTSLITLVLACFTYLAASLIKAWKIRSQPSHVDIAPSIAIGASVPTVSRNMSSNQETSFSHHITNVGKEEVVRSNLVQALIHTPPENAQPGNRFQIIQVQSLHDASLSSLDQVEEEIQILGVEVVQSRSPGGSAEPTQSSTQHPSLSLQLSKSKSTLDKAIKVISFGGFFGGTSLLLIVLYLNTIDTREELVLSTITMKILILVFELMPVYWMRRIPEAREFMLRHLPNFLQGVSKTLLHWLI